MPMKKNTNKSGEVVLSKEEVIHMTRDELSLALKRFNRWRRGKGEFKWSENRAKNKPCPYSPATIGHIIDVSADLLSP